MKKGLVLLALVLVVSTSVIAGTLAMYTTRLDAMAQGSTVAKEFKLTKGDTDSFAKNVKIAPGESQDWQFSVKNYDGNVVSETAMGLSFEIDVTPTDGKDAIAPLQVTVKNEAGDTVGTLGPDGKILFNDKFPLQAAGQQKVYTVSVKWPSNDATDINYAGAAHGTAVKVSVTGTQE